MPITIDEIRAQIDLCGIKDKGREYYWYFYALNLDNKPCAKMGRSTVKLDKRIERYLNREHATQAKKDDSFRLIMVIQFKRKSQINKAEEFIQGAMKEHPLNEGQHHLIEQYNLQDAWDIVKTEMSMLLDDSPKFPFATSVFVHPHVDEAIDHVLSTTQTKKVPVEAIEKPVDEVIEYVIPTTKHVIDTINKVTLATA